LGRPAPLALAANEIYTKAKPVFFEQVATLEHSIDCRPIENAAWLFAYAGDNKKAKEALDLTRLAFASSSGFKAPELVTSRLSLQGRFREAFEVWLAGDEYSIQKTVQSGLALIQDTKSPADRRDVARRIVSRMHAVGRYSDWELVSDTLIELGLKSELKSILDMVCANPHQNDREKDDAFRGYIAIGDTVSARRIAFPHDVNASWLLDVLLEWDVKIHGPKEKLLDVAGLNVFEEGITGFQKMVVKFPHWLTTFEFAFEYARGSKVLTERTLVEFRTCLALQTRENVEWAAVELIKSLVNSDRRHLLDRATQRRIADELRASLAKN
jgi:hypothetical protein